MNGCPGTPGMWVSFRTAQGLRRRARARVAREMCRPTNGQGSTRGNTCWVLSGHLPHFPSDLFQQPPGRVSRTLSLARWRKACPEGGGRREAGVGMSGWSPRPPGKLAPSRRRALGGSPGGSLTWARAPICGEATAVSPRTGGPSTSSATVKRWASGGQWGPVGWLHQSPVGHSDHQGGAHFLPGQRLSWPGGSSPERPLRRGELGSMVRPGLCPTRAARSLPPIGKAGNRDSPGPDSWKALLQPPCAVISLP